MSLEEVSVSNDPKLEVVLIAGGVEVARSESTSIWLQAMAAIKSVGWDESPVRAASHASAPHQESTQLSATPSDNRIDTSSGDRVSKFAADLEVSVAQLRAAADPSDDDPFIHLDPKYWESFKRTSGYGRVSPTVLIATLLLLWERHNENVGEVTTRDCAKVASAVGLSDKNPTRGINNCDWLQIRGKNIRINPTEFSQAEKVAAAYCCSRGA